MIDTHARLRFFDSVVDFLDFVEARFIEHFARTFLAGCVKARLDDDRLIARCLKSKNEARNSGNDGRRVAFAAALPE
jgi:hypothetical protein